MLFTSHSVVGGAIGVAAGNPALGFLGGAASHHVLDAIPHFDQSTFYIKKSGPPYLGKEREPQDIEGFKNKRDWIMLFIDWALAGFIFGVLFTVLPPTEWPLLIAGAAGGLAPDILDSSPLWSKWLRAKLKAISNYHRFHLFFHWTVERDWISLGIITQIIAVWVSLVYLLR